MSERVEPELRVFDDPSQLAAGVADAFVQDAREAIRDRGEFNVALAGGTTPKAAYQLLAAEPRRDMVDWPRVNVFFGDERTVPPDSSESNYKMANDALLAHVPLVADHVHRMHGEDDPIAAARDYSEVLTQQLGPLPRFDLVLLGMGPDGHTASLFPGSDPRADEELLVRAPFVQKFGTHRLTLTPMVLNNARHVVIATEGLTKAPALYAVLRGPYNPVEHPVQIIAPVGGRLSWFADRAAAAELS
ncbi:MAG TPA: 6-phosphogluconolactonase [Candidatus Baltobacteraceae bacterium]|nr:6-phosphogluconolactonase [Candidatus Baltobacteraceae bacterium]